MLPILWREGDGLHLSLRGSRSEEAHYHHQQNDEHQQPTLEHQPVGLPEPCGGIPEGTVHDGLARVGKDVGKQAQHTDDEATDETPFTCLWRNLLREDTQREHGHHGGSQQRLDALQIAVERIHRHHHGHPSQTQQHDNDGGCTAYEHVVSLALTFLHGLVEVLGEQGGAAVEEGSQRSHEGADEADGDDTLHTHGQHLLHHAGKGGVGVAQVELSVLGQGSGNHTGDKEHEHGEQLEVTGGDGTTAGTLHHFHIALTLLLTKHTLNDVLVGTPVPEADDRGTDEHHEAGILAVERVALFPVEHVGGAVAVVQLSAVVHHGCPAFRDAAATEGCQSEEEHEERADDEDRSLNGRERHHALHATEDRKHGGDGDEADGTPPEGKAQQILEEDTTRESGYRDFRQHIGHQRDDAEPRAGGIGVAELQEVGHGDNLAQLVVQQLIEGNEEPAEDEDHPALHLPVGHTHAVLGTSTGQAHEVLGTDVGGKDSRTNNVPRLALTEQVVL